MTGEDTGQTASPAAPVTTKGNSVVAEAETVAKAVVDKAAVAEAIVKGWVAAHLSNSPLSRATEAWNHLQTKLKDLATLIEKEL